MHTLSEQVELPSELEHLFVEDMRAFFRFREVKVVWKKQENFFPRSFRSLVETFTKEGN
jgi:hypothetical protein